MKIISTDFLKWMNLSLAFFFSSSLLPNDERGLFILPLCVCVLILDHKFLRETFSISFSFLTLLSQNISFHIQHPHLNLQLAMWTMWLTVWFIKIMNFTCSQCPCNKVSFQMKYSLFKIEEMFRSFCLSKNLTQNWMIIKLCVFQADGFEWKLKMFKRIPLIKHISFLFGN